MSQHKFDDFLKQKLNQRQFEFKDPYWLQAEKLIEDNERDDKWRFMILLFAGLLLLISGIGIGTYYAHTNSGTSDYPHEISGQNIDHPTISTIISDNSTQEQHNTLSANTNENSDISDTQNNTALSTATEQTIANSTVPNNTISNHNNANQDTKTGLDPNSFSPNYKNTKASSANPKTTLAGTTTSTTMGNENTVKQSSSSVSVNDNPVTEDISNPINGEESREANHKPLTELQPNQVLDIALQYIPYPISALDNRPQGRKIDIPLPEKADKKLSVGVRGSALLYLSLPNPAQGGIGFTAGLTAKYQITPKWGIALDGLYHVRKHQFANVAASQQVDYSFGRVEETYLLTPSAIHSFEAPLYVAYNFAKKHEAELGLAPTFLYGVKGDLYADNEVSNSAWVATDAYRKMHLNLLLGYNYNITNNLSLGIRARYTLGGIINKDFVYPSGVVPKETDKLYFDLNAKFDIF